MKTGCEDNLRNPFCFLVLEVDALFRSYRVSEKVDGVQVPQAVPAEAATVALVPVTVMA